MLAITVAVRIDVYGVIYVVVLGLLFLVPRKILRPIWFVCLPVHGVLLAVQYLFLLGAPPSVCYNKPHTTGTSECTFIFVAHIHMCTYRSPALLSACACNSTGRNHAPNNELLLTVMRIMWWACPALI